MNHQEFLKAADKISHWLVDYYKNIEQYPVKSPLTINEIKNQLPALPPDCGCDFETIFNDFKEILVPGITHWQHPNFLAFFPSGASYPSILAEFLSAGLGIQCMMWETSPAATELEELTCNWLKTMLALPSEWQACIQDTASTSILTVLIAAREKLISANSPSNHNTDLKKMCVYLTTENNSSSEKSAKIAGFQAENIIKLTVNSLGNLEPQTLINQIESDLKKGLLPCAIIANYGSTGVLGIDPIDQIGKICQKYGLWLHVDAAYLGAALILPECQQPLSYWEHVDSFNFNPHKWLLVNFDCSILWFKNPAFLLQAFAVSPIYLKAKSNQSIHDYRNWSIQLGRRFRALKLWFVIRSYGVKGLQDIFRKQFELTQIFYQEFRNQPLVDFLKPAEYNMIVFRFLQAQQKDNDSINAFNEYIAETTNGEGKYYITKTIFEGKIWIRLVFGNIHLEKKHIEACIDYFKIYLS